MFTRLSFTNKLLDRIAEQNQSCCKTPFCFNLYLRTGRKTLLKKTKNNQPKKKKKTKKPDLPRGLLQKLYYRVVIGLTVLPIHCEITHIPTSKPGKVAVTQLL